MEKIKRPKEISRAESNIQNNEYIQKNLQTQLNRIYDKLDEIVEAIG